MKRKQIYLVAILGVMVACQAAAASKAHVTDSLRVTLRTGPSIKNKIVTMLSSGQPVERVTGATSG